MMDDQIAATRQRDLRLACIHEHAHAAVAIHFGIPGQVTIIEDDIGSYVKTGWADFAGIWLERIEPPKIDHGIEERNELMA